MKNKDLNPKQFSTIEEAEKWANERRLEQYRINTGSIFDSLTGTDQQWKRYNRDFLKVQFQEALEIILYSKNIITAKYDGKNDDYLENYRLWRYPRDLQWSNELNRFPFPDYFLKEDMDSDYQSIVNYAEPCIIEKGESYFDLFFALQFSLEDIIQGDRMNADEFLSYHLEHTFENNLSAFKDFIDNLCIKYEEFLKPKYKQLAQKFFQKIEDSNQQKAQDSGENFEKLTWCGSPSQFSYLFLELAQKGLINFPLTNGETSFNKYGKICWNIFTFECGTTMENIQKEMNPKKNTLRETMRSKFTIPDINDINPKKGKVKS